MAICKTCGKKYSKWTTPIGARGVCGECFGVELGGEHEIAPLEDVSSAPETIPPLRMVPIRLTSFLPRSRSKVIFVFVMSCYCIAVSSFIATWTWVAPLPSPPRAFYLRGDAPHVLALLIFGPLIESLMIVGVFELARRFRAPNWAQVLTSALFISALHLTPWWPHAVIVLPAFLIQCASYSYWRRASWKEAFWVLVCIHSINNVIPALSAVGRAMRHV